MTREEAIRVVRYESDWLQEVDYPERGMLLERALTTLATAVRYEPPTVEEVGDDEKCWVSLFPSYWETITGKYAREAHGDMWIAWLPYSAIPEGGA